VIEVRGGIIQGRPISADEIATLATLPSLEVLRGQLVGAIAAPLSTCRGPVQRTASRPGGVLQARIDQLQAQGEN
jgi:large subunit ribosomal protein L10